MAMGGNNVELVYLRHFKSIRRFASHETDSRAWFGINVTNLAAYFDTFLFTFPGLSIYVPRSDVPPTFTTSDI